MASYQVQPDPTLVPGYYAGTSSSYQVHPDPGLMGSAPTPSSSTTGSSHHFDAIEAFALPPTPSTGSPPPQIASHAAFEHYTDPPFDTVEQGQPNEGSYAGGKAGFSKNVADLVLSSQFGAKAADKTDYSNGETSWTTGIKTPLSSSVDAGIDTTTKGDGSVQPGISVTGTF